MKYSQFNNHFFYEQKYIWFNSFSNEFLILEPILHDLLQSSINEKNPLELKKIHQAFYDALLSKNVEVDEVNLTEFFSEFHIDILNIISATTKEQIIVSDIIDLKPIDKWQDENVCLIGDAAHATTPNLGQGACQAIEDAYVLGKLLDNGLEIEKTFATYEILRRKKAHTIVNTSWTVGKMAHIENSFGIWLRNFIMKNIPKSANKKQMDTIFNLN